MPSPIWIKEDREPAATRLCPCPGCGREYPIRRYRYETDVRSVAAVWRGSLREHGQEFIPVPDEEEWVRLVPVIGTAT